MYLRYLLSLLEDANGVVIKTTTTKIHKNSLAIMCD